MVKLTKAQQIALKHLFDRDPIYPYLTPEEIRNGITAIPLTYKQFRRTVKQGYDCIMVQWAGMWIGIEPDGYTHS